LSSALARSQDRESISEAASRSKDRATRAAAKLAIIVVIALAAVAIRLLPLSRGTLDFAFRPDDSFEYLQLAAGLAHGCGFARLINGACQAPELLRTPGYPLFLAALPSVPWILAAQALLSGVLCLLIAGWLAVSWNFPAALIAELLIAFDCPSIVMANEVMSEALFQIALAIAVILPLRLALRHGSQSATTLVSAAAAAAAILIRPIAIILPVTMLLPFLAMRSAAPRRRAALAAVAFAIPAIAIAGWSLRNYRVAKYPGLSTIGAINMYYYRAADVVARNGGVRLEATRASFGAELGVPYEHIYEAAVQSRELEARMNRLAIPILVANPVQTLAMTIESTAYLALTPIRTPLAALVGTSGGSGGTGLAAGAPSIGRVRDVVKQVLGSPLLAALVGFQIVMILFMWAGIARAGLRWPRATAGYRLWTAYPAAVGIILLIMAAGGEADARFRAPVVPLLAVAAALGYFPRASTASEGE
jgi:hypothetical protein